MWMSENELLLSMYTWDTSESYGNIYKPMFIHFISN